MLEANRNGFCHERMHSSVLSSDKIMALFAIRSMHASFSIPLAYTGFACAYRVDALVVKASGKAGEHYSLSYYLQQHFSFVLVLAVSTMCIQDS